MSKDDRIASRLNEGQRVVVERAKKALRVRRDSDLILLFTEALERKSPQELREFFWTETEEDGEGDDEPDPKRSSITHMAA